MDMTSGSSGPDQAHDPTKVNHPEEEEQHETGAGKMYRRVKARAKKFKNSLTKHGNENEEEEDDEDDDQSPQVQGVKGQPESLSQGRETSASETKVSPVPLRDTSYGHEASSPPVRVTPSLPTRVSDLSDREEIRETHQEPLKTPVSLLPETEERTFAPAEDNYLDGQQKVNRLEEESAGGSDYLGGVSKYETKDTDPKKEGYGEAEISDSLGRMQVSDDHKSELGFGSDLPMTSNEPDQKKTESGTDKYASTGFGSDLPRTSQEPDQKTDKYASTGFGSDLPRTSQEPDQKTDKYASTGFESDLPRTSQEPDQKAESGIGKYESTGFESDLPRTSHQKTESGVGKYESTGFEGETGTEERKDFVAKGNDFNQETDSGIGKDSPAGFEGESRTERREDFSDKSNEFGVKEDRESHLFGKKSDELEGKFSGRNDDVKVESELGRDSPMKTHDQFSPALPRPDNFDSKDEEMLDQKHEPKTSTYTEIMGSPPLVTDDAVPSKLGYSGEATGGQRESSLRSETPETTTDYEEKKVVEPVEEKVTPVDEKINESGTSEVTKLPISGGGSGVEEDNNMKRVPSEEDKALWESLKEERKQGEAATEEVKPEEGMVGKIKGAVTSWFGGAAAEEVKPTSPGSVKESPQSLGSSTVDTKPVSDSGASGLEVKGRDTGAVTEQKDI